jgi:hypothetical protein
LVNVSRVSPAIGPIGLNKLLHRPRCFIAQVAESAADNKPITARRQGQELFHRIGDV